jgi:hypothetical protein
MASFSDQGISDLILLWLKLELVDPAGSNNGIRAAKWQQLCHVEGEA